MTTSPAPAGISDPTASASVINDEARRGVELSPAGRAVPGNDSCEQ
jgi:hypothetical protein